MENITCPHCSSSVPSAIFCSKCGQRLPILQKNLFSLFDMEPNFEIDKDILNAKLIEKLSIWHPDKFVNSTELTKKIATDNSALINHAYKNLSSEVDLISYLLSLEGVNLESIDGKSIPQDLLMDSMEWREDLENSNSEDECKDLLKKLLSLKKDVLKNVRDSFREHKISKVTENYIKLKFIERFIDEIDSKMEMIDETL